MNLTTISHIPGRNLKAPYVTTIAGLALAISALVAFGPSRSTSQPVSPSRQVSVSSETRSDAIPMHTFILAANVAQQEEMESADTELRSLDPMRNDLTILLAGSPAAKAFLDEGARELMAIGASFQVIDMTASIPGLGSIARSQVSDTDIAASVLSTELANYLAPVPTIRESDADISASVLSTEMAAYDFTAPSPAQRQALEADIMASVISTEKAAGY